MSLIADCQHRNMIRMAGLRRIGAGHGAGAFSRMLDAPAAATQAPVGPLAAGFATGNALRPKAAR